VPNPMKVMIRIAEYSNNQCFAHGREAERSEETDRAHHDSYISWKYIKMMDDKQSACALHSCP